MTYLSNFHTHSLFCDGSDSIETMVQAAVKKNFKALGFSSHSLYPYSSEWHMPLQRFEEYAAELRRLRGAYKSSIAVFTGFEADYFPVLTVPDTEAYKKLGAEYIIGSVHYVSNSTQKKGFAVDGSPETISAGIERNFGGSGRKLVECYYETVRSMIAGCSFDFVGHIDLIRKYNGVLHFFDESDSWYKNEIRRTARAVADNGCRIEINTGGIARGVINSVYPSAEFLKELFECHVPVVINSDAHKAEHIDCAFDIAEKAAREAGYTQSLHLVRSGATVEWAAKPL